MRSCMYVPGCDVHNAQVLEVQSRMHHHKMHALPHAGDVSLAVFLRAGAVAGPWTCVHAPPQN